MIFSLRCRRASAKAAAAAAILIGAAVFTAGEELAPGQPGLAEQLGELRKRVGELEAKITTSAPHILPAGIGFNALVYSGVQAAFNPNNTPEKSHASSGGQYAAYLVFHRSLSENGLGFLNVEVGDGLALHSEVELFSGLNNDWDYSNNKLQVAELWYQHTWLERRFTLKLGRIDLSHQVDQGKPSYSYAKHFLNEAFFRAKTIDFPGIRSPGISATFTPGGQDWHYWEAQIANGKAQWDDIFDDSFVSLQMSLAPSLRGSTLGRYRVYGWLRSTNYAQWSDPSAAVRHKSGFGVDALWGLSDDLDLALRYGWADPRTYDPAKATLSGRQFSLEHMIAQTLLVRGRRWGRDRDHIAVGAALLVPSMDYRSSAPGRQAKIEENYEIYYMFQATPNVAVSPDFQLIRKPFGCDAVVNGESRCTPVTSAGLRAEVAF